MPVVISRAEAKAQGLKHYFTGQPCPRGHVDVRGIESRNCLACLREKWSENKARWFIPRSEKTPRQIEGDKERQRRWRAAKPDMSRANVRNRRARIAQAEGSHTAAEIAALYQRQRGRCGNCKASLKPGYHADHTVPLARGGSNWISNIQLLCPPCNQRKHAKDPIAFALEQGRLV